ncbi:MAG TPA: glycosyltransferase family 1 protein [Acidimicrobiales bacterium]|nr:glycosyltransferase family 1 protein [Acidimicrobiales bacterium]
MSDSLQLSLDLSAVPSQPVGAGRYAVALARALTRRDDVSVTMWARKGDERRWRELVPDATVQPSFAPEPRPVRLAWEQVRLPGLLRHAEVDVHHGPHYTMPRRSPVPTVVTVHDMTFFDDPQWHERSKVYVFRHAINVAARHASAIVCVSKSTGRRFEELCHPRSKIFVAPHGVDHERFRPEEQDHGFDESSLRNLSVRQPYVLFLGTLEPRKAVPELIAAFDRIARSRRGLSLVLAGRPGWGAADVEVALARSSHKDRVRRLGYVADEMLPSLLRRAEVVAYPSREEGFGLPALEALACGSALVTSEGTVMAELAGEAAFLAKPGSVDDLAEALSRALDSAGDPLRRRLGLEIAGRYTWEKSAEGHMSAYRWAMEARGG